MQEAPRVAFASMIKNSATRVGVGVPQRQAEAEQSSFRLIWLLLNVAWLCVAMTPGGSLAIRSGPRAREECLMLRPSVLDSFRGYKEQPSSIRRLRESRGPSNL